MDVVILKLAGATWGRTSWGHIPRHPRGCSRHVCSDVRVGAVFSSRGGPLLTVPMCSARRQPCPGVGASSSCQALALTQAPLKPGSPTL